MHSVEQRIIAPTTYYVWSVFIEELDDRRVDLIRAFQVAEMPAGTDFDIVTVRDGLGCFGAQVRRTHEIIREGDEPTWYRDRPERVTAVRRAVGRGQRGRDQTTRPGIQCLDQPCGVGHQVGERIVPRRDIRRWHTPVVERDGLISGTVQGGHLMHPPHIATRRLSHYQEHALAVTMALVGQPYTVGGYIRHFLTALIYRLEYTAMVIIGKVCTYIAVITQVSKRERVQLRHRGT